MQHDEKTAKTARERKAAQRARDARAVTEAIGCEADADLRVLVELLRKSAVGASAHERHERTAWRAWCAIGKREGWIDSKDRVIEPKGLELELELDK